MEVGFSDRRYAIFHNKRHRATRAITQKTARSFKEPTARTSRFFCRMIFKGSLQSSQGFPDKVNASIAPDAANFSQKPYLSDSIMVCDIQRLQTISKGRTAEEKGSTAWQACQGETGKGGEVVRDASPCMREINSCVCVSTLQATRVLSCGPVVDGSFKECYHLIGNAVRKAANAGDRTCYNGISVKSLKGGPAQSARKASLRKGLLLQQDFQDELPIFPLRPVDVERQAGGKI
jgi:hypothetical protein